MGSSQTGEAKRNGSQDQKQQNAGESVGEAEGQPVARHPEASTAGRPVVLHQASALPGEIAEQAKKPPVSGTSAGEVESGPVVVHPDTSVGSRKRQNSSTDDDDWECSACTFRNARGRSVCGVCDQRRFPPNLEEAHWICPLCSTRTPSVKDVCCICSYSRPRDEERSSAEICRNSSSGPPRRDSNTDRHLSSSSSDCLSLQPLWICSSCTCLNSAARTLCSTCERPRKMESEQGKRKMESEQANQRLAGPVRGWQWVCPNCTCENAEVSTICSACESPRDPEFEEAVGLTRADSITHTSTRTPGDSSQQQELHTEYWVCSSCTCRNTATNRVCSVCEAPRTVEFERNQLSAEAQIPVLQEFVERLRKRDGRGIAQLFRNHSSKHPKWASMNVLEHVPLDALRGEALQFVLELTHAFKNSVLEQFLGNLLRDLLQTPTNVLDLIFVFACVLSANQNTNAAQQQHGWLWDTVLLLCRLSPMECLKKLVLEMRPRLRNQGHFADCDRLILFFAEQVQTVDTTGLCIDYDVLVIGLFEMSRYSSICASVTFSASSPSLSTTAPSPRLTPTYFPALIPRPLQLLASGKIPKPTSSSSVLTIFSSPLPSSSASDSSDFSGLFLPPTGKSLILSALAQRILTTMRKAGHAPVANVLKQLWVGDGLGRTDFLHPRLPPELIVRRLSTDASLFDLYDFVFSTSKDDFFRKMFAHLFRVVVDSGNWNLVRRLAPTWGKEVKVSGRRLLQGLIVHRIGDDTQQCDYSHAFSSPDRVEFQDGLVVTAKFTGVPRGDVLLRAGDDWPENLNAVTRPAPPFVIRRRVCANIRAIYIGESYEQEIAEFCQAAAACGLQGNLTLLRELMLPYQVDTYLGEYQTVEVARTSWSVTKCFLTWLGAPTFFTSVLNPPLLLGLLELKPLLSADARMNVAEIQAIAKRLSLCFEFYVEEFLEEQQLFPTGVCHIIQDYLGDQRERRLRRTQGIFCGSLIPFGAAPILPGASASVAAFWRKRELLVEPE